MKKVTILTDDLGYGGIEKSVSILANYLTNYAKVEVISLYKLYEEPAFSFNSKVNVKYLTELKPNKLDIIYNLKNLKIFSFLLAVIEWLKIKIKSRKALIDYISICDSNIIISTNRVLNKYLGNYKKDNVCTVAWEHFHHHDNIEYIKLLVKSLKNIDKLVVLSKSLADYYKKYFIDNNINCTIEYIPDTLEEIPSDYTNYKNNNLIAVGKMTPRKAFEDLITVFKLVDLKTNDVYLNLVGDGSSKNKVFKKIVDNNLTRKVHMYGYLPQKSINKLYKESSIFCMTSHTEAFGITLLEAMSYKLPIIAFDSAEGAKELIKNNYNGYLIKNRNEYEMADKIVELLNNKKELKRLGENAYKTALTYQKEEILKLWNKILALDEE